MSVVKLATQEVAQTQPAAPKMQRVFVGHAWKNTVKREGPNQGKEFIRISLDRSIVELTLKPGIEIQMWPNNQRPGSKDADYRLSILEPVQA